MKYRINRANNPKMKTYYILIIISIFVAAFISCDNNRHEDEHVNQHDESLHMTAYSSEYEVYVTASPFFAGQTVHVLTHITILEDFKPLTQGRVTAILSSGNEPVKQTLAELTQAGIYEFEIKPAVEGTGILSFEIETDSDVSVVTMQPVEIYGDVHEAISDEAETDSHNKVSGGNSVSFLKEQSWRIDFSTEMVKEEAIGQIIRSTGQIRNTPEDVRVVSSAMGGFVQFTSGSLFVGTEVNSGQSLFRIDGSSMADNNLSVRFAEAESEYNRAKAEYERKEILAAERIVSESELNKALAEYKSAEANYNNLRRNFTEGSQSVNSPISGYIKDLLVDNGQYVDAGEPIMTLSQNRRLIIQTDIQPKYYDLLDNITSVNFRMLNSEHTYSMDETGGEILAFGRSVDLSNPLITLTIQLENGTDLFPGSLVELFMKTEGDLQVLTVPNESIVEEMGNYFVYVQQTPELFEKRLVVKGATDGRRTEIKDGLSPGERVVGKGAVLLKLSQSTGSVDVHSGHVH